MYTELTSKALRTAAVYHDGQKRKGENIPYIVHPVEVGMALQEAGMKEEIIAAGLLHDVLEDTEMESEQLKDIFNERILELVIGASETLEDRENTSWKIRKKHTLTHLPVLEKEIKYIVCADKLNNVKSMLSSYDKMGDELWQRFNAGYENQKWYYQGLVKGLKELEGEKMYVEFKNAVSDLFNK